MAFVPAVWFRRHQVDLGADKFRTPPREWLNDGRVSSCGWIDAPTVGPLGEEMEPPASLKDVEEKQTRAQSRGAGIRSGENGKQRYTSPSGAGDKVALRKPQCVCML